MVASGASLSWQPFQGGASVLYSGHPRGADSQIFVSFPQMGEESKPAAGKGIGWVDFQHPLQAFPLGVNAFHNSAQPEPGPFVVGVQGNGLPKQFLRLFHALGTRGGNSPLHQLYDLFMCFFLLHQNASV